MVFKSISSNIAEVLSINPSANVSIFGDLDGHHTDWLTYPGGNDLTQMINFPTQILDCDSYSPALLDFFLSSDASICSAKPFPPLVNSDHVVVSVSIDFLSNSQRDAPFHRIVYDYSRANWDGPCEYLRDVPWEDILGG